MKRRTFLLGLLSAPLAACIPIRTDPDNRFSSTLKEGKIGRTAGVDFIDDTMSWVSIDKPLNSTYSVVTLDDICVKNPLRQLFDA